MSDSKRVQAVYEAALQATSAAAQAAVLDQQCGADLVLREQVVALLQAKKPDADDKAGTITSGATLDLDAGELAEEAPACASQFAVGSRLGKYEIKAFLSRGGMGEVYRGFDPLIERDVALKVLPPGLAANKIALQRFLAEARAVGKLLHPHTVALYEIDQSGQTQFLAMEFVPGGSLADLVKKEGKLDWKRATRFMLEVCGGLAAAHAVGVMHRDIKPENLLRTLDDHVKITDFGLAKAVDSMSQPTLNLTKPGHMLGTPVYMSPEQFIGVNVDQRTDIYSAGATYYHLLTGQRPYADAVTMMQVMYAHSARPVPDPRAIVADVPALCAAIVARAMAKEPGERYATAADMAVALAPLLVEKRATAEPVYWVVEPSRLQARIIQGMLQDLGCTAQVFGNMSDTLAAAARGLPAVIFSAMHLDDGTGEELADRVREMPQGDAVFLFLISSDASIASPYSFRPGRPVVLVKPVTKDIMTHVVERVRALRS